MMKQNNQNSALKMPLNQILSSKGHLIVLRSLAEANQPMSHSELIERTTLSRQGVYDVVSRLAEEGIISGVGSGSGQQVVLRKEHPLADIIKALFVEEEHRFDDLIQTLKKEIQNLDIKPSSAWIFGKVAEGLDSYGDSMRIALLGDVQKVDDMVDAFREKLYEAHFEKRYDITIYIRGVTTADLESEYSLYNKIILLWGPDPQHYLNDGKKESTTARSHQDLDRQSLSDAEAWSELLKSNRDIIARTIDYLKERIPKINSGEKKEFQEWKHILESMSFQRLKKFLESDEQRSKRLRQSMPFWPVLKEREREKYEKLKSKQE